MPRIVMIYCINPQCIQRSNLDNASQCAACGTPLVVNGSYRLLRILRESEQIYSTELFEVSNAWDNNVRQVLKSLVRNEPLLLKHFTQEQKLLTNNLEHSGIPKGKDSFLITIPSTNQELHCFVMEWIEGEDLSVYLKNHGAIDEATALEWLEQITNILAYVHKSQIFHRDIKPSNIMRRANGQIVLIDFGAVRSMTPTVINGKGNTIVYSHGFTAPEQRLGNAVPQSDFYALGRTFAHLLMQKVPDDDDLSDWEKDVHPPLSSAFVTLIDDLIQDLPQARPQSAQKLQERIEKIKKSAAVAQMQSQPSNREPATTIVRSRKPLKRPSWLLWSGLLLLTLFIVIFIKECVPPSNTVPNTNLLGCTSSNGDDISCGEKILTYGKPKTSPKANGSKAMRDAYLAIEKHDPVSAQHFFAEAKSLFKEALDKDPNDPEVRIYYNNARIQADGKEFYTIAVAVPLNGSPGAISDSGDKGNRGLEILRGVAQAQEEAYNSESKFRLRVLIGDDHNDEKKDAPSIASEFGKRSDILAVVGHYTSEGTAATLCIYQEKELVLISPTSTTSDWENNEKCKDTFFRTVPSNKQEARGLAEYLFSNKQLQAIGKNQQRIAIFYRKKSLYSRTLQKAFNEECQHKLDKCKVLPPVDISQDNFNSQAEIDKANKLGVTALAVFPDGLTSSAFKNSLDLISKNKGKLSVVSGNSLFAPETLDTIRRNPASSKNLVIAVSWDRKDPKNKNFAENAKNLWKADVNWRSAMSYDAAKVIIAALSKNPQPDRKKLLKILKSNEFNTEDGYATGIVSFDGSNRQQDLYKLLEVKGTSQDLDFFSFTP
jgi:eukaryotic-like serine/threonine-protein kinase